MLTVHSAALTPPVILACPSEAVQFARGIINFKIIDLYAVSVLRTQMLAYVLAGEASIHRRPFWDHAKRVDRADLIASKFRKDFPVGGLISKRLRIFALILPSRSCKNRMDTPMAKHLFAVDARSFQIPSDAYSPCTAPPAQRRRRAGAAEVFSPAAVSSSDFLRCRIQNLPTPLRG